VDVTSQNNTELLGILYNGILYESMTAFRSAWSSPSFEKLPKPQEGDWCKTERSGEPMPFDSEPGPVQVSTSQRYAIDYENNYIEWMDFSFHMGVSRYRGLALYNINYQGERIIFELGKNISIRIAEVNTNTKNFTAMQEALAHYASNDPVRGQTFYLDSMYGGFGQNMNQLVPGWDCPATATYLDTAYSPGSICVFERDAGFPMARHNFGTSYSIVKNIVLVARTIATVGNYDYMFDYEFRYDGSIEVTVRASGYIEGTYFSHNEDYGYHIHDALSGAMVSLAHFHHLRILLIQSIARPRDQLQNRHGY
jgi:primary-amine oxidase